MSNNFEVFYIYLELLVILDLLKLTLAEQLRVLQILSTQNLSFSRYIWKLLHIS